jgi:hypothetical protein
MSEAAAAVAACKTSVSEYLSTKGGLPANNTAAGCSVIATQYVAASTGWSGTLISFTSANTGASPAECTLTLTPTVAGVDITGWTGGFSGCSSKYVPSSFRS